MVVAHRLERGLNPYQENCRDEHINGADDHNRLVGGSFLTETHSWCISVLELFIILDYSYLVTQVHYIPAGKWQF